MGYISQEYVIISPDLFKRLASFIGIWVSIILRCRDRGV